MASTEALSSIVRSLSRDVDERTEAIAVLLDLSDIQQVRQRIGRIKGCIVMLVTLRNAHESGTVDNAEKLLSILSSNPQNVLLMAEAGYFLPLIQYLKQGIMIWHTMSQIDFFLSVCEHKFLWFSPYLEAFLTTQVPTIRQRQYKFSILL